MVEGSGCSVCTLLSLKLGKQDMHSHRCLETKHHQISITPVPLAMQTQISTHLCEAFCNSYVHMNRYESIWNRLPVTGYPSISDNPIISNMSPLESQVDRRSSGSMSGGSPWRSDLLSPKWSLQLCIRSVEKLLYM